MKKTTKKITYTEPNDYIPKAILDKHFGKKKATTAKKAGGKKKTK